MNSSRLPRRAFVGSLPLTVLVDPSLLAADQDIPKPGFFHGEITPDGAESWWPILPWPGRSPPITVRGTPAPRWFCWRPSRFLKLPESHLGATGAFGGGIEKGDLCGFLTGSLIAFGLPASMRHSDRTEMRRVARSRSNENSDWWLSRGDLHCAILRPTYDGSADLVRMAQRTAFKTEELMRTALLG